MKTILFFFISFQLLTVIPFTGNLTKEGVIACEVWKGGVICVAHNYLGGESYKDLQVGDEIKVMVDGVMESYEVVRRGEYEYVEAPKGEGKNWNGLMWMDGKQVTRSEMVVEYSSKESITMVTCWETKGQIILQLKPKLPIDFGNRI
ncbi:MAG: hypothetical protein IPI97_14850 [Nitrosomonas sp.]|nr:hypothetical protein [Nitrosomonas sp.]